MKCASTSVQNILLRYAIKHNLNIVLPEQQVKGERDLNVKYTILDWTEDQAQPRFDHHFIQDTLWEKANLTYDMFLLHTRWNHREISHIMNKQGKQDVYYFSILRDPVAVFRSFWDYYGLSQKYRKTLDEYVQTDIRNYLLYNNMPWNTPGYNSMLNAFGMYFHEMIKRDVDHNPARMFSKEVTKKIDEIEQSFNLILLADDEHFEHGMVLLKQELCWEWEDIISVMRNVTPKTIRSNLSKESKEILKGNDT